MLFILPVHRYGQYFLTQEERFRRTFKSCSAQYTCAACHALDEGIVLYWCYFYILECVCFFAMLGEYFPLHIFKNTEMFHEYLIIIGRKINGIVSFIAHCCFTYLLPDNRSKDILCK